MATGNPEGSPLALKRIVIHTFEALILDMDGLQISCLFQPASNRERNP